MVKQRWQLQTILNLVSYPRVEPTKDSAAKLRFDSWVSNTGMQAWHPTDPSGSIRPIHDTESPYFEPTKGAHSMVPTVNNHSHNCGSGT